MIVGMIVLESKSGQGALAIADGSVTMTGGVFEGNKGSDGGALDVAANVAATFTRVRFANNQVSADGAIMQNAGIVKFVA